MSISPVASRFTCPMLVIFLALIACPLGARNKNAANHPPVVRWQEGDPECTLSRGADGIYRYSLSYETLSATLAVDSQEVEKNRRILEHVFRVLVTVRNRGTNPVYVYPKAMTLELVDHYHVQMRSQDPDDLAAQIQNDSDTLVSQSEKELKKHPERKPLVEARLRDHEKLVAEWQEYLTAKTLRNVALDHAQPEVTGLVFFPTRSKWKGDWKPQEHFIVRLPLANLILEFPFALPLPGDLPQLRERLSEPPK